MSPTIHDLARTHEIHEYDIQSLRNNTNLDEILRLAIEISDVPSAAINMLGNVEELNIVSLNWNLPKWSDRKNTYCSTVVDRECQIEVEDTANDPRFLNDPLAIESPEMRYYAGFPLKSPKGFTLGTLCVSDIAPKRLTTRQKSQMSALALFASALMDANRTEYHRQRVTSVMQIQSKVLQHSLIGQPFNQTINELTLGIESYLPEVRVSLMTVMEDKKRLFWIAGPSMPASFADACRSLEISEASMPCAVAAFRREEVVCSDIEQDVSWQQKKATLLGSDIRAFWCIPLFATGGELIGTLALYYRQPHLPSDTERELIDLVIGTASIVIERDRMLRSVIESERQLIEAQEIARLGSYTIAPETGLRTGSPIAFDILGLPRNLPFLTAAEYHQMIHPDDVAEVIRKRELAAQSDNPSSAIYRIFRRSDGAMRWIEGHFIVVKDMDGRIIRYSGAIQDITERREVEMALRLNQRAVESSASGVIVVDALAPDMPITYINPAFGKLTGYAKEETIGKNCRFLQGTDRDQAGLRDIRYAIQNKQEGNAILKNYRKDGTEYWVDLRISPVKNDDGVVTHYVGFQIDISDRIRNENELQYLAGHDSLTGLVNRTLLMDRIEQAVRRTPQTGKQLALMFIDLDRFKIINDSLGHAAGDLLLKECARRILANVKVSDTVARMGGDEFVVLFDNIDHQHEILKSAEAILSALNVPYLVDSHNISISASAGLSLYPSHGTSTADLLRHADIAMYHAKSKGRANCQLFSETLHINATEKLRLKEEIVAALQENQFCLHYQPKISAKTNQLVGFEALVRWNHPTRGLIFPDQFIGASEELGLIVDLGT